MSRASALAGELGRLLRFSLVGVLVLPVDAGVLLLLVARGLDPALGRPVAQLAAMHLAFVLNGLVTFGRLGRGRALLRRWLAYLAANGLGALASYALFVAALRSGLPILAETLPAFALGSIGGLAVNFLGSRHLAFRPHGGRRAR